MLEEYIYCGTEKLRCGYTTGSCAAAAAKASVQMLLTGLTIDKVSLMTPKGILLELDIENPQIGFEYSECAVEKDSGDDPDVTNGILVYARAEKIPSGIIIDGGKGVGRVTKSGLDRKVGEAAINTIPRKMIENSVTEIAEKFDYDGGFKIVITVPEGEKIAEKTYNPRLGIVGGISIIGTSGIVEPMSTKAVIETIRTEESMIKAQGRKNLLITIGNYSGTFLKEHLPELNKT
ncbi:MAG: cobalt-precorrin-5B (C(1))-methyltransferase CbiD, partial [Oscillospiraceae bacterium]|nr:cobalt-precorrin-5B (C(1))-methyltransferase CbiD [Oscillospiraceae bacterium]